jgi:hypothetical protein
MPYDTNLTWTHEIRDRLFRDRCQIGAANLDLFSFHAYAPLA